MCTKTASEKEVQLIELRTLFNIIHEDCNKLVIVTIVKIIGINKKKNLIRNSVNECFPISRHGLSPGDCTMAIQPLEDNHQYLTTKNILFIKSKLYFKDMKMK